MANKPKPYFKSISDKYVLKSIQSQSDLDRLARFNGFIHHDKSLIQFTRTLYHNFPKMKPDYWLVAEEIKTKKIGRNSPCPCGSGKKYKNCCLR